MKTRLTGDPVPFEARLQNYASQPTLRKKRGPDGLTAPQRRRLVKKDQHEFAGSGKVLRIFPLGSGER